MGNHRTVELAGALLDAAVAMAEGLRQVGRWYELPDGRVMPRMDWEPSCDWSQAGQIIERECIAVFPYTDCWAATYCAGREDWIDVHRGDEDATGETPLVAAMRAFVLAKLGEEVELTEVTD